MKQTPFWVDDYPLPGGITSELPDKSDYLVVGSGLTGLSAALRLADAGNGVTVVDSGTIAGGASSINGGMVSPDVKAGVHWVHATHGPGIARQMWDSTVESLRTVERLADRSGNDAITHRAGMAALGRGPSAKRKFSAQQAWYQNEYGVEREILTGDRLREVVGGDYFDVGVFEPDAFGVHPARLAFGLAKTAHQAGVRLVDQCAVTDVSNEASGATVRTSRGRTVAGTVIIATNGYTTREPSPRLARLVVPIGSYIIVTEPLGEDRARSIFPSGAMTFTRKRLLNYMRRTHDNRILMGGRRNLHTDLDLAESAADLRQAILRFWPELDDVELSHAWGGRLGIPFDLLPHIGQVDGVWYAMGYGGHGVGLSTQLGHELAGMLLGTDPPSVYSRIPHRGRFYYRGKPWFLTPASMLYRTLDRMGL